MTTLTRLLTGLALAALFAATLTPAAPAPAQTPRATPPARPDVDLPRPALDDLWMELLACDCPNECCKSLRERVKKRLKDPDARPKLAPEEPGERAPRVSKSGSHHRRHARAAIERRGRFEPFEGLDLTDEQRRAIRDVREQARLDLVDLRAALAKQRIELRRSMRDAAADRGDLRRRVDALAKTRADIEYRRLEARLDARAFLTDEQRERLRR